MSVCDVGIVGGGPAGAWAAYRLARAGARVMLVDASHPREKPCGGGLTGRALDLVRPALGTRTVPSVRIAGATFEHAARRAAIGLTDDRTTPALVVASRRVFDDALLQAAVAAGATHVRSRARDVERTPAGWRIVTGDGDVDCRWIVGADGPTSLVRRRVFRPFTRADLSIATGCFVHGATSQDIAIAFEDRPAGYLWSFPRPDHLAVGICAQADESTTPVLQSLALRWIARSLPAGAVLERYAWPIPSLTEAALRREQPAGARWMLVGDAAGLVDPITREGIYFALRSGDLAADSLLSAGDPAARFSVRIRADIHAELGRAARLKARFFRPHFISLLLRGLQSSAPIADVMGDLIAGRQTYRGLRRRLLSTLELRLMLDLYRQKAASFQLPASS
jgi:geranylgeranyl diphosphate/geranylgeranyl-bacteriochlorophyllide a reductase